MRSLFLWCALVLFLMAAGRSQGRTLVTLRDNLKQTNQWKCSKPKPRLVYLEDEYLEFDSDNLYLPHAAVVNRCDRTVGCCKQPGQECIESEGEDVAFIFEVISPSGAKHRREITLRNHLSCACQSSTDRR